MKRRSFLIWGSIISTTPYLGAKDIDSFKNEFQKVEALIKTVQGHMFPEQNKLPSARSMNTTKFLFETIIHPSYDKDIRSFVLEGAQELNRREKNKFVFMSQSQKERALRAYEKTDYGRSWLSRIMTLTMEAIFSDPIYGSNIDEAGWRSLGTFGGYPRPKRRYLEDV